MSETMQAPIEGEAEPVGSSAAGNRRLLIALAAVAGVVVVGAAVYFLFLSGGSEEELGAIPQSPVVAATDDANANGDDQNSGDGTKAGDKVPVKYDGNVGRDPFQPLALETEAPPATAAPTDQPTSAPTDAPTDPVTDPTTNPTSSSGTDSTSFVVVVKSVNVARDKAVVSVNGSKYTVSTDEVFPSPDIGPFQVVRLGKTDSNRGVVKVLYGSDLPVILKEGNSVTFGSV
ncbi:MAG TPA: hypothetical protein VMT88_08985 [Actinomycetes bacterium]|nr:hypothetical protein [Actinomycetes bacterium]